MTGWECVGHEDLGRKQMSKSKHEMSVIGLKADYNKKCTVRNVTLGQKRKSGVFRGKQPRRQATASPASMRSSGSTTRGAPQCQSSIYHDSRRSGGLRCCSVTNTNRFRVAFPEPEGPERFFFSWGNGHICPSEHTRTRSFEASLW